jgi:hypothetical protein
MGLHIKTEFKDERFGRYSYIHVLRKWVYINIEGNTEEDVKQFYYAAFFGGDNNKYIGSEYCPELLNHSDAYGGYIDYEYFGIKKVKTDETARLGDIKKLADEMKYLAKQVHRMPEDVKECFKELCTFIFRIDGKYDEYSRFVIFE